jgi:hypothetical protein
MVLFLLMDFPILEVHPFLLAFHQAFHQAFHPFHPFHQAYHHLIA